MATMLKSKPPEELWDKLKLIVLEALSDVELDCATVDHLTMDLSLHQNNVCLSAGVTTLTSTVEVRVTVPQELWQNQHWQK